MDLFSVNAQSGVVTFSDASVRLPSSPAAAEDLRALADEGKVFSLDSEDPVALRLAIFAQSSPPELPAYRFQRLGGSFLLHLPSGRINIADQHTVAVDPGSYSLSVLGLGEIDARALDAERQPVLTTEEWRFRRMVERLCMFGCIPFLAAWIILLVYGFTIPSLVATATALLLATPGYLLSRTGRYRATEHRLRAHDESFPHYVIHLRPVSDTTGLIGGRFTL